MKNFRDNQRSLAYGWEEKTLKKYEGPLVPFHGIQSVVNYVWEKEGYSYPPIVVKMNPRRCAQGSATRTTLEFPEAGASNITIIHEIAHALTSNIEGESNHHGARWVGVYMKLLDTYMNISISELIESADKMNLKYNFDGPII